MHPQLTLILAQQHTVDLHDAANRAHPVQAAVNAGRRNPAPRVPTSMAGRFAHILPDGEREVLAATWQTGPLRSGSTSRSPAS